MATHGVVGLLIALAPLAVAVLFFVLGGAFNILGVVFVLFAISLLFGMFLLQPNQALVVIFLGKYVGTAEKDGWYWTNPYTIKRKVSLRVQNFNTQRVKVNDAEGNPIEIAAVVVWRVRDTARATFDVESYRDFIDVQAETALRHIATQYPYDLGADPDEPTLRGSAKEVGDEMRKELQARLDVAGIEVMETRLTHLAYSAEIAGAMLQRQQATAIVAARERIATGAVGIVETVLEALQTSGSVNMTAQQKAEVVSSLLIVLTSDRGAQPVLATG